ncbi:nuclear transport factor 2 family protein [Hymenobacter lutimineralis]|uniref:Nuclear transport factor 2 family protein n=1 Tax=Hymenobacter lutimineralis TaxID=2606448 RepID=A0A5D6UUM1_9BACT|nr:nuclear transport factor 2 family protein [Hymenobacter lutimineralis]TYZ06352.1 nuclear transport factor 2 family protein [Hymenobacter lutimineralis]
MRTSYRALVPMLLLTSACATTRPTAARQDILQVLSTQTAAWNRGDVAGFMQGYWQSDSLVFIGKSGLTYGWQPTLDNYRRSYPSAEAMGQLTFSNLRVQPLSPAAAHVLGRWHLARPAAGDLSGHFLLVLRKLNGRWVIVADHSS